MTHADGTHPAPRSLLDVIDTAYVADVVASFRRLGVFDLMMTPRTTREVSVELGLDGPSFDALVDLLRRRTDLFVGAGGDRLVLAPRYRSYRGLGFFLDVYLGAYRRPVSGLDRVLRGEAGGQRVDRRLLARAFRTAGDNVGADIVAIVQEAHVSSLLELACGTAPMLRALCALEQDVCGIAVDSDARMCTAARAAVRAQHLTSRIRVLHADARNLNDALSSRDRRHVDGLFAQSLFNEFCRDGGTEISRIIRRLRRLFPGRPLFVLDYFGTLGQGTSDDTDSSYATVHDVAQIASGQGVPPATHEGWARLYEAAGAELVGAYEGSSNGASWFLHRVSLT